MVQGHPPVPQGLKPRGGLGSPQKQSQVRFPSAQTFPAPQLSSSHSRMPKLAQVQRWEQFSVTKLSPYWRGEKGQRRRSGSSPCQAWLSFCSPRASHPCQDLVVDAIVGAATVGHGKALGTTVHVAREAGTAFHAGALTVPGGCQAGTGGWAGHHAALIDGIGRKCQG